MTEIQAQEKIRLLRERLPELYERSDPCKLCPRRCLVHRRAGEAGECGLADLPVVSSIGLHHGNERPISGDRGSGNIFISGCSLHCLYCQNWEISQAREGRRMTPTELADAMLDLQDLGAHNINVVTPTHVVSWIAEALLLAMEKGLRLPLVYNTSGYDLVKTIALLDGIVDVYLPDMKYGDAETALRFSDVAEYPTFNQLAVREMFRQVGPLVRDEQGVAVRGVLVRHLVLPENLGNFEKICDFLDREIPGEVYVNVMAQYRPCYRAASVPSLSRRLHDSEYEAARATALARKSLRLIE
jgi:putative pyruvate formate lyase activating enzyme